MSRHGRDEPNISALPESVRARLGVGTGLDGRVSQWRRHVVKSLKHPWKRHQQVPSWDSVRTVELHEDEHLLHAEVQGQDCWQRFIWTMHDWLMPMAVGVLCFLTYVFIEICIGALSSVRFGFCTAKPWRPEEQCPEDRWVEWGGGFLGFCSSVGFGTAMAAASAWLVVRFAPAASGSGIPEVKTILNGFVLPDVATARTLCIKVPGLILAVASGMALGHEGPMVHIAVCWAQLLSRLSPQFKHEGKRRELYSAAVAAGVSSAFGTPVGGVLFSLEEVSSHFPSRTLLRAFIASVVATLALSVTTWTGMEGLTLFSVRYTVTCHPSEYFIFALLGITGGIVGALFNAINIRWNAFRAKPAYKKRVRPVAEVMAVAFITLVSSWPLELTRPLSPDAIHAMFDTCAPVPGNTKRSRLQTTIGLCSPSGNVTEFDPELLTMLGGAAVIRFCQTALTIGTACPAGLFVPSLFIGACLGRCTGGALKALNQGMRMFNHSIDPGVYSMVGAAAVLGGVCRMTISLVVIMLELTGGLDYVVPFMLSVLLAKAVGDALNESIYDLQIVLKGYPFLHEELDITFTERCCDIMETELIKLDMALKPRLSDVQTMLKTFSYRGFPVVDGTHFLGYVRRSRLDSLLANLNAQGRQEHDELAMQDLVPCTDFTVMRMVPDAPLSQAHQVFKQLGCQHIFVVGGILESETNDALLGILSKKSFLRFLKDGRVGHMPTRQYAPASASPMSRNCDSNGGESAGVSPRREQIGHRVSGELMTALEAAQVEASSAGEEVEPPDSSPGEEVGASAAGWSWREAAADAAASAASVQWFASRRSSPPIRSSGDGRFFGLVHGTRESSAGRGREHSRRGRGDSGNSRAAVGARAIGSSSSKSSAAAAPPPQGSREAHSPIAPSPSTTASVGSPPGRAADTPHGPPRVEASSVAEVFEPP